MSAGKTEPITIILLGDIAAGKATHSHFLRRNYGCIELDMGRELRRMKKNHPKTAELLAGTMDRGKLAQTELVREIIQKFISRTPKNRGILFDGTPKMIGEARLVRKWLAESGRTSENILVLYLKISKAEMIKRMHLRGAAEKRSDDTLAAVQNRIKYYKKNISAVSDFFKKHYAYKTVSSMGSIPQVEKNIEHEINTFFLHKDRSRNRNHSRKR
jgi:adenylate kinase family enzyme